MKRQVTLLQAALAVMTIFLFPGCEKAFDYLKEHPGENASLCPIRKLVFSQNGQQSGVLSISYNAAGNPTSIETTSGFVQAQQYHFRYDKYGRLSDYILTYFGSAGGVVTWDEYTYPDKKTVIDSAYEYTGNVSDPVHPTDFKNHGNLVTRYSLDASGRIIKTAELDNSGTPYFVSNFAYDSHGNLIRSGVTYDNKVNVYQTNKVWMFIHNDYSVNNELTNPPYTPATTQITSYNAEGLPLIMNASGAQGYIFNYDFNSLQIIYDCDLSKAPSNL